MHTCILTATCVLAWTVPVLLAVWWKRRSGAAILPFIAGAAVWVLFARVLEQLLHFVCLVQNSPVSMFLKGNAFAYALYAGLAAGIFEETGRYIAFRLMRKKYNDAKTAVAYGIGHGGIEVMLTLGAAYLMYVLVTFGVSLGDAATDAQVAAVAGGLHLAMIPVALLERVSAMLLHIGLSAAVCQSVNRTGRGYLFPAAILIHAAADFLPGLYAFGLVPVWLVEAWALLIGAAAFWFFVLRPRGEAV